MQALIEVILPVFLVIGAGYAAVRRGILSESGIDGLMKFTLSIALPCLLFRAISDLDLAAFEPKLIGTFYLGATFCFVLGIALARIALRRPWPDAVVIGFCALFSNSLLLGLPITERAFGADALAGNYAIVSLHAPFCYSLGVITMEIVRSDRASPFTTVAAIAGTMSRNALVLGIALGFVVNLGDVPLPHVLREALDLLARAAIPAALFGLGGIMVGYRLEGSLPAAGLICAISLLVHPAFVFAGQRCPEPFGRGNALRRADGGDGAGRQRLSLRAHVRSSKKGRGFGGPARDGVIRPDGLALASPSALIRRRCCAVPSRAVSRSAMSACRWASEDSPTCPSKDIARGLRRRRPR